MKRVAKKAARGFWQRYGGFFKDLVVHIQHDDLGLLAAALAHYALLSLVPLLLLLSSVAGMFLDRAETLERATELFALWFPVQPDDILRVFERLVRERGTVGGFGLLALLWVCMRIFVTLQRALDHIWNIHPAHQRPYYWQVVLALPTIAVLGVFAWISILLTSVINSFRLSWPHAFETWAERWVDLPDLLAPLTAVVASTMSIILMFMIYRLLPSAKVRTRSALIGAVVAGVLWELAKYLFTLYINRFAQLDRFYGTTAGIITAIVWTYVSALILLFGAEVVECHARWIAEEPVLEDGDEAAEPEPPADHPLPLRSSEPGSGAVR